MPSDHAGFPRRAVPVSRAVAALLAAVAVPALLAAAPRTWRLAAPAAALGKPTSPAARQGHTARPSVKLARSAAPGAPARPPAGVPVPVPAPAPSRPTLSCSPASGVPRVASEPWAQRALEFSSVWAPVLARGQGVTVAVVDSGVDAIPQLAGRVTATDLTGTGMQDCVGHGTEIASIIAASDMTSSGVPFVGVAPQARILSVKYTNQDQNGSPALLARGIRDAAELGADVINVSSTVNVSTHALRSAVDYALSRNAVVVASAGNDENGQKGPFYPADYPGVLSVGAVESNGALAPFSDQRTRVTVTAPGASITAAAPGGYVTGLQGTSYATAFVSGVAALVRSHYKLTESQVVRTIRASADGSAGVGTGNGLVNPVRAVTTVLPAILSTGAPSPPASPRPVAVARAPAPDRADRAVALELTAGTLGAAVLTVLGAVVITYGRRRRWRPGQVRLLTGIVGKPAPVPCEQRKHALVVRFLAFFLVTRRSLMLFRRRHCGPGTSQPCCCP
ncbi:MAG TPA: S8 family serine peptidase [Streptosporangiaceae bacterium]|nr:S8 family serine peptidase [Streptosporangiaceae bacterium]